MTAAVASGSPDDLVSEGDDLSELVPRERHGVCMRLATELLVPESRLEERARRGAVEVSGHQLGDTPTREALQCQQRARA
jgi:hypothetical protein